jgi:hypothetical protein
VSVRGYVSREKGCGLILLVMFLYKGALLGCLPSEIIYHVHHDVAQAATMDGCEAME